MEYLGQEPTEPRRPDQGPRTSSQFLQVGYRLQTQDSLKMKLQSMSNKSIDDDVEEISANMIQNRHEVPTSRRTWKGKDEKTSSLLKRGKPAPLVAVLNTEKHSSSSQSSQLSAEPLHQRRCQEIPFHLQSRHQHSQHHPRCHMNEEIKHL